MGKYSKYTKNYNPEWEKHPTFKGWLQESQIKTGAYCNICRKELRAHKADLLRHKQTNLHKDNATKFSLIPVITQKNLEELGVTTLKVSDERKIKDIQFSVYVTLHSAVLAVDHLSEIVNELYSDNLRLHRTKCSAIIKNVIAPTLLEELIEDVGDAHFSLIIDESTDISVCKYLAICIRYFSFKSDLLKTAYLGMYEVTRTTASDLYEGLVSYLRNCKLNLKKLVGIGTDGASNLYGVNHPLYTLLKQDVPNLELVKCVCHSIHICASKAVAELPSSLDFLVRESYKWFSHSPLRKVNYESIYILINDGRKPLKLVAPSETRWLSRYYAVARIIDQWIELKAHFQIAGINEKCYTARVLYDMYNDDINYLYLFFLKPILKELNECNLFFQNTNVDVFVAFKNLKLLVISFCKRILRLTYINFLDSKDWDVNEVKIILDNPLAFVDPNDADLGYMLQTKILELKLSAETIFVFKERSCNFLKQLTILLLEKLPANIVLLNKLKNLSPCICLNSSVRSFNSLPLEYVTTESIIDIEIQWRNLINVNWREYLDEAQMTDSVKFWTAVLHHQNAIGEKPFYDLACFNIKLFTFPVSNAVVERVFSIMNCVKTKTRNKLNLPMLDAIMRIKLYCYSLNTCCRNFKPSKRMMERFSAPMYVNFINTAPEMENEETWKIVDEIIIVD